MEGKVEAPEKGGGKAPCLAGEVKVGTVKVGG